MRKYIHIKFSTPFPGRSRHVASWIHPASISPAPSWVFIAIMIRFGSRDLPANGGEGPVKTRQAQCHPRNCSQKIMQSPTAKNDNGSKCLLFSFSFFSFVLCLYLLCIYKIHVHRNGSWSSDYPNLHPHSHLEKKQQEKKTLTSAHAAPPAVRIQETCETCLVCTCSVTQDECLQYL